MITKEFGRTTARDPQAALDTLADQWYDIVKFSAYLIIEGHVNSSEVGEFLLMPTYPLCQALSLGE